MPTSRATPAAHPEASSSDRPIDPHVSARRVSPVFRPTPNNQHVTLVPDPTLPAAPPGATRRAYVVLASQLSYTDAVIRAGWAAPGDGLYRPVLDTETKAAQKAHVGMWGPPCNQPTP